MSNLITVYITNHNYGKYLEESIKSVLKQSYKNFFLIIIDDNSKDDSKLILQKYKKNKKIKIFCNKKSVGLTKCANFALKKSKGGYLLRLDADDLLKKSALKDLLNVAKKNKKTMMVFPNFYNINERSKVTSSFNYKHKLEYNLYDTPAHGACSLINANFLRKIGGYNENFSRQDGHYLWYSILSKKKKITHINKYLFFYRKHKKNISKNKKKILLVRLKIINFFLKRKLFIDEFENQKKLTKKRLRVL
tara:strand:- start:93 stop:839 length:747 start_codon:yes stop_codon:yes gene_type:complete